MSTLMVDGTTFDVPAILQRFGSATPVAGYVTGQGVEWLDTQFALFSRKIRIAQSWLPDVDDASIARCLDMETGAATANDWPGFYDSRGDRARATAYNDLSNVPATVRACEAAQVPLPPRWWLAWWWNRPGYPTVAQVLAELKRLTGVELDPQTVWAIQYADKGPYDLSRVYGLPDFSRR